MFKITCKELTDSDCDNVTEAETKEEAKNKFFAHGAESPVHAEKMKAATDEQKAEFGKKLDEYLNAQG